MPGIRSNALSDFRWREFLGIIDADQGGSAAADLDAILGMTFEDTRELAAIHCLPRGALANTTPWATAGYERCVASVRKDGTEVVSCDIGRLVACDGAYRSTDLPNSNATTLPSPETIVNEIVGVRQRLATLYHDNAGTLVDGRDDMTDGEVTPVFVLDDFHNTNDELILGFTNQCISMRIDMGAANATTATMTVQYWNGTGWTTVSTLSDTTLNSGATLGQDGTISFAAPTNWAQATITEIDDEDASNLITTPTSAQIGFSESLFFLRMAPSTALDSEVEMLQLMPITGALIMDSFDTLANGDAIFIGSENKFDGMLVTMNLAALQGTGSRTLTVDYWNGVAGWTNVDTVSDGTSGSTSLDQHGDITWLNSQNWRRTSIDGQELYWVRLTWNGALDSETEISAIQIIRADLTPLRFTPTAAAGSLNNIYLQRYNNFSVRVVTALATMTHLHMWADWINVQTEIARD